MSYLWFLDALRSAGGLDYLMTVKGGALDRKFDGGMQQVAQGLARGLGDRIVLEAPVLSIAQDASGVRVATTKGEYAARFIIVAVPPSGAGRIRFEPAPARFARWTSAAHADGCDHQSCGRLSRAVLARQRILRPSRDGRRRAGHRDGR